MKNPNDLNAEQFSAVTHADGPLIIVAGAGTGKTTVITRRIAWLIQNQQVKSDQILALTFTDKAANEMEERVDRILPLGYVDVWIHTFHAFCQRILDMYGIEIGLPLKPKLLNETQAWILMHRNLERFALDYYRPLGNPTKFLHALLRHFSRLKDEAITPQQYLEYAESLRLNSDSDQFIRQTLSEEERAALTPDELGEVTAQEIKKISEVANAYHVYQELLVHNDAMDFGDLINYCLKLLSTRPKVLAQLRQQFRYILVDEFQDTNWAQYQLVKLLAAPRNNLTVCGDDDQSIYKFRGASVSNILQFKKDFPATAQVCLVKNYRSRQNILDAAYAFIQKNNPNRLEVSLAENKDFSKKLLAERPGQGIIRVVETATQETEMRFVIRTIRELKEKNPELIWSDFAILVRANSHADIFNYGLAQSNIPFYYVASRGLYNKGIVLDILAYLKLLDNYHESPALYRILSLPVFRMTQAELVNLNYWAKRKGRSLYSILTRAQTLELIKPETLKKVQAVVGLIDKHSRLVGEKSVRDLVLAFLTDSGYLQSITRVESEKANEQVYLLNQFYKKISDFEAGANDASVKNFLQLMELEIESGEEGTLLTDPESAGPEAVRVTTIHAAKGLEFKHVFIVNVVERRFPTSERKDPIEIPDALVKEVLPTGDIHVQEERRLMYVACTRAKDGLYITLAKDYGGARKKKPSVFIAELAQPVTVEPDALVEPALAAVTSLAAPRPRQGPGRFSFSQLKAFENCPWQYRYAFVLKVPVRGKAVFSFGKTIHSVMQKVFEQVIKKQNSVQLDLFSAPSSSGTKKTFGDYVKLDDMLSLYETLFIDDWYRDEAERNDYYAKGKKLLKTYFESIRDEALKPVFLEKSFTVKVNDNRRGIQYSIYGVIDRVDETDQGLEIIDYKTGRAKKDLVADDKEQLLIYQLAGQDIFEKPITRLTFHYLEENIKKSFVGSEPDLGRVKSKILSAIEAIEQGQFVPKPGPICRSCDFRDICEFRSL